MLQCLQLTILNGLGQRSRFGWRSVKLHAGIEQAAHHRRVAVAMPAAQPPFVSRMLTARQRLDHLQTSNTPGPAAAGIEPQPCGWQPSWAICRSSSGVGQTASRCRGWLWRHGQQQLGAAITNLLAKTRASCSWASSMTRPASAVAASLLVFAASASRASSSLSRFHMASRAGDRDAHRSAALPFWKPCWGAPGTPRAARDGRSRARRVVRDVWSVRKARACAAALLRSPGMLESRKTPTCSRRRLASFESRSVGRGPGRQQHCYTHLLVAARMHAARR